MTQYDIMVAFRTVLLATLATHSYSVAGETRYGIVLTLPGSDPDDGPWLAEDLPDQQTATRVLAQMKTVAVALPGMDRLPRYQEDTRGG